MKTFLRSTCVVATVALASSAFAAEPEVEAIDIGQLLPATKGEFVEINLSAAMLKFAAKLAARQEPEAAKLLAGLKSIRVNVVSMDDTNREEVLGKIESARRKLEAQGWAKMVTVRNSEGGDNVDIHVKQRGEDAVDGLVLTVVDGKNEAVFVNIVGNINADQISQIANRFEIEPLRQIGARLDHARANPDA